jgi:histidinol-phosphate aminotransferase
LKDFASNLNPFLSELEPDDAGLDREEVSRRYGISLENIMMLSRNENPYGPSPRVWEAMKDVPLQRYPNSRHFVKAVSDYTGFPEENIVVGAGMDEIITTNARLFLGRSDKALIPVPTYNLYGLAVRLCGARPVYQPRLPGFEVSKEITKDAKMIFLCTPNNPTGNSISEETVRAIADITDGIVFLDEAYAEFAKKSLLNIVKEHDNIAVGRTLSKAFGLAGLRLGYAVVPSWIAEQYRRVAPLFSISSFSLAAGEAALRDLKHMRQNVSKIVSERERMHCRIEGANPSQGNFLYIETPIRSAEITDCLLRRGIVVRDCSSMPGAGGNHIRVTVGTPEQNDKFLEAYRSIQ